MTHASRPVFNSITNSTIWIDVELARIMQTLWRHGVGTVQCCQHDQRADSAWIQFAGTQAAARFAGMLFSSALDEDDLMNRQREWEIWTPEPDTSRAAWRWKAAPNGAWDLDVMVEFPVGDLPEVERRLITFEGQRTPYANPTTVLEST